LLAGLGVEKKSIHDSLFVIVCIRQSYESVGAYSKAGLAHGSMKKSPRKEERVVLQKYRVGWALPNLTRWASAEVEFPA
jgi:hypothetical protein